jgi:hypothetical protein
MSIIYQLSSQQKDRSEKGNRIVAAKVMDSPELIHAIFACFDDKDNALLGDCVEVCTMIAENDPALIAPFADKVIQLLDHKNTRVRWEAMHATALITCYVPEIVGKHWKQLAIMFSKDKSVIVRDYIVVCAGNLATCDQKYAEKVYPFLLNALSTYQTHHAKLALEGLAKGFPHLITKKEEITEVADLFLQHPKPTIRKAAQQLKKRLSDFPI